MYAIRSYYAVQYANRSQFIEQAIRVFLAQLMHAEQNAHDIEILNRSAEELNHEAMDALVITSYSIHYTKLYEKDASCLAR